MDAPIALILETLENYERFEKGRQNIAAQVHAFGWSRLLNGFSGEGADKLSPVDLLPHPDLIEDKDYQLSNRTRRILVELIKTEKLPVHVVDAATDLDEVRVLVEAEVKEWQLGPT